MGNLFRLWSVQSKMCKKSFNVLISQVCSSWEPATHSGSQECQDVIWQWGYFVSKINTDTSACSHISLTSSKITEV